MLNPEFVVNKKSESNKLEGSVKMSYYIDEHTLIIDEKTIVMAEDPLPNMSSDEVRLLFEKVDNNYDLTLIYAVVFNKVGWDAFDIDDYERGTPKYINFLNKFKKWESLLNEITDRVLIEAEKEKLLLSKEEEKGLFFRLEPFMNKYGFINGNGWWISEEDEET